jgi:NOL1/NOP2/sun family putative RNA methylase
MPEIVPIPPRFLERMSRYLGREYPGFEAALAAQPVSGLRVNTLKISTREFQKESPFSLGEGVPWAPSAFLLPSQEESPGLHPHHLAGLYYLQDPSAIAPAVLLDPQPGERLLDLAAAPGGKTTYLAALMQGSGLLVANEIKDKRLGHLVMNVERWAAENVVITNETPERLADAFGPFFDRVLVDAPCSGEGMFRKDMGARADWSLEMVRGCAVRQRNILRVAAKLVRPGGRLLYSTCTFAPEEDEEIILHLLDEFPEYEVVPLPDFPGFLRGKPEWSEHKSRDSQRTASLTGAVRLFPHRVSGEGHFACLLQRREDRMPPGKWKFRGRVSPFMLGEMDRLQAGLWQAFCAALLTIELPESRLKVRGERLYLIPEGMPDMGILRVASYGVWLGNFKKGRFEPAHPLALFLKANGAKNVLDLKPGDPLLRAYLRGETLISPGPPGWTLVCVDGFGLGWGKRVQGVMKNHYPRGWMQFS